MLELVLKPWVATCDETRNRISDYLDGELDGRNHARVSRHLARCRRCRAVAESLTRALEQLRALGSTEQLEPAPAFVTAVRARIERASP